MPTLRNYFNHSTRRGTPACEIMFKLSLYDRNGIELSEGDIVRVSNGRQFTFYSEVKYLPDERAIAPFHTFSFHSFEKVERVPENAIESTEDRYKIWWLAESEDDPNPELAEKYLIDWRQCEHLLEKKVYQIQKI